ncbi:catalytic subunit of meta cleavage enzyme [Marinobacterium iners]|uniref:Catalytic subunit of meta cleavage enzyme n=1 Tax=Acinetobacter johnsonii TaxID=40214 RepID=A0A3S9AQD5_ACIJO|nr:MULTISPECIES: AmmeMemoRadiSam system protein B [Gammaproteobacteria]AZN65855.1 catalytic subunit of meta cleavage enzyme [Acinetobacter johnsonii]QSR36199.1 catalytic subunit of meta cleavage enzyme [Marinobacterium iners]
MANIVSSCATSHIVMSANGCEDQARNVIEGMKKLGNIIKKSKPDIILIISSDHMCNFDLSLQPRFAIGISDEYTTMGDMDIPIENIKGSRLLANTIVETADQDGFDLCQSEELKLDHGIMIPLTFMDLKNYPIVPLIVNINTSPMAEASRCVSLARTIKKSINELDEKLNISVIAAGGLSHWLCIENHGEVSEKFDHMIMDRLCNGEQEIITNMGNERIIQEGGNAGIEILTWLMASEISGNVSGEKIYYEPMRKWFTGVGGINFEVN